MNHLIVGPTADGYNIGERLDRYRSAYFQGGIKLMFVKFGVQEIMDLIRILNSEAFKGNQYCFKSEEAIKALEMIERIELWVIWLTFPPRRGAVNMSEIF